jgi:hypothetical protein
MLMYKKQYRLKRIYVTRRGYSWIGPPSRSVVRTALIAIDGSRTARCDLAPQD